MDDDEHNTRFESVDDEYEYEEVYGAEDDDDDDDDDEDEEDEEFDDDEVEKQMSEIGDELKCSQSQTLDVSDFGVESNLLSEVPVEYTMEVNDSAEIKNQVVVSHQEPLVSVTAVDAQTHFQNEIQFPGCPTSSLELSPTSVTQSISSGPSPALHEQRVLPVVDQQKSSHLKPVSAVRAVKTPSADGYNWRKYGQKQVKSPQGSRSYYKCTFLECCSKKIECCDHSNSDIKIIYRGVHNHDPPRKSNCTKENRLALSVTSVVDNTVHPIKTLDDTDPPLTSKEPILEIPPIPDKNQQNSSGSNGNAEIYVEEHVDEPEPKRRMKQSSAENPGSLIKPGKKPKYVVHAAGDVGISGDGYRWRKYGQKMVKGNPHPRNYYKCTSAGCPVRKHIERAVDSTTAVIITYKGTHDHDMPVPKKRHGPPSAPLVAAAAPVSMNSNMLYRKNEALQNQIPTTQWSVDTDGELTCEALDLGEEKAMESARTLLSIGFEIKPC